MLNQYECPFPNEAAVACQSVEERVLRALVWGEEGKLQQTRPCADDFVQHLQKMYEQRLRGYLSLLAFVTPDPNGVVY